MTTRLTKSGRPLSFQPKELMQAMALARFKDQKALNELGYSLN